MVDDTLLASTARDSTADMLDAVTLPEPGYQFGDVIGRGGMGEVVAAHDRRIGREVAIKRLRDERPDAQAIVPVHEMGTDAQGRPYFTMKRLAGTTLAQHITDGTAQNRLLRAFIDVCQAVKLAHAHGVVHRDLKPHNIMLGEYGEVYVLDWGIARVLGDPAMSSAPSDIDSLGDATQTGALLGTPGYMAPEQVKGIAATTAADVYALGAILFEILTREPLHPRGGPALAHTLAEPQVMPSKRVAQVAPELDAACHDALAEQPEARPSVHVLAERVQAYLDGDRDLEARRALATEQIAIARTALAANDRATAMQTAGRALALDRESKEAAEIVTKLIVEPPDKLPAELVAQLEQAEQVATRARVKKAIFAYSTPLAIVLVLPWVDVKSWSWLVAFFIALGAVALVALWSGIKFGRTNLPFLLIGNIVVITLFSRLAGPLMLTPVLACGVLLALASHQHLVPRPGLLLAYGALVVALPFVLEMIGVLPSSLHHTPGGLLTTSTIFQSSINTHYALIAGNVLFVFVHGLYSSQLGRIVAAAQHKLHVQAWHLRKLLPTR
jgi:serine/threonine-protein kinase